MMMWERSWAVLGAAILCTALLASPAEAQQKYRITQPNFKPSTAQLINGNKTLIIDGPLGRFLYQYDAEQSGIERALVYDLTKAPNGVNAPGMLKWPQRGNGALLMRQVAQGDRGFVWVKIGDVRPIVPTKPKPKPTPPKGDAFPKRSWRSHNGAIVHLAIRDDSNWMAAGDANGATRLWNLNNYKAGPTLMGLGGALAYRRGGNLAGARAGSVGVWRGGNTTTRLSGVPARVNSLAYRGDGGLLAVGGLQQSGTIQLWDDTGAQLRRIKTLAENQRVPVRAMAFTPNHRFLITASGGTVTRWNLSNYSSQPIARANGVIQSVATAARGNQTIVVAGGTQGTGGVFLVILDGVQTKNYPKPIYSVALNGNGTRAVFNQGNKVLYGSDARPEPVQLSAPGTVRSVAISPNGSKIAAAGTDGVITVWNAGRPTPVPAVVRVPPNFRVLARILDQQTQKLLPKATITSRGGPGRCNPLEWKPTPASHYFEMLAAGTYQFRVTCPGYKTRAVQLKTGNQELKYDIRMFRDVAPPKPTPTGSFVLLKVQDQNGKIVLDPTIQFIRGPGQETADGEASGGLLRFKVTKPGDYSVMVSKEGYTSQTVTVRADGQPKAVTLHRVFKLRLTIRDADKQPVIGPTITIDGPGRESGARSESPRGTHILSLSTNGNYKVTVRKQGFKQQSFDVELRDRETSRSITLPWGFELALTVIDSNGQPIDKPKITITGPGKGTKVSSMGGVHTYALTSNGLYQVTVARAGFEPQTRRLGTGKSIFKLRAVEYELVVRVPAGGDVSVVAPKGSVVTRRVDAAYSLWLSPGTYKLSYTNDDEFTFEKQVAIKAANAELKFEPDPFPAARRLHRKLDSNGDKKLTKDDIASGWDELWDRNGDGEIEVKEIAAELSKSVQDGDQPSTMTPLPAKSHGDAVRSKLDSLPTSGSGWAKKDVDPQTWEFFKKLDTNGDEVIDTTEQKRFTDAVEQEAIADSVNDSDATTVPAALVSLRSRLRKLDRNGDGLGRADFPADAWLWLFRNFDKNKDDKLDATEELTFLTEFQSVVMEHLKGKSLVVVLRPLFRKRDKDGNGVDDTDVDTQEWKVLATFDIAPKNGRIDRDSEETAFLKAYEIKLKELFQLLIEADRNPPAPPPNDKAAQLRARLKRLDTKNDGLDTGDVDADTWITLFAQYDTNKNDRLDPTEEDALVQAWKPWVEDPVDEPIATKRRVLKIRKIR